MVELGMGVEIQNFHIASTSNAHTEKNLIATLQITESKASVHASRKILK
jgi:hypothetical protein